MDRIERALDGDINLVDYYEKTALMYASDYGHIESVKLLLDRGADPNIQNEFGYTALMYMDKSQGVRMEIVELLLDKGSDPNIQNEFGYTALMYASTKGHTGIVKLLLDRGACPNVVSKEGKSALMWATDRGNTRIVKLIKEMTNLQHALQNLALAKSMNSPECDSPLQCLDYDIMKEIMICNRTYDHGVHLRMKG